MMLHKTQPSVKLMSLMLIVGLALVFINVSAHAADDDDSDTLVAKSAAVAKASASSRAAAAAAGSKHHAGHHADDDDDDDDDDEDSRASATAKRYQPRLPRFGRSATADNDLTDKSIWNSRRPSKRPSLRPKKRSSRRPTKKPVADDDDEDDDDDDDDHKHHHHHNHHDDDDDDNDCKHNSLLSRETSQWERDRGCKFQCAGRMAWCVLVCDKVRPPRGPY